MYSLCCIHLVKCTIVFHIVDIFATRYDAVTSVFRSRRQVQPCTSTFKRHDGLFDGNAHKSSRSPDAGKAVCLRRIKCTGYSVLDGVLFLSTSADFSPLTMGDGRGTTYRIELRCPIHNRCDNSPCENGGSCIDLPGIGMECICGPLWK